MEHVVEQADRTSPCTESLAKSERAPLTGVCRDLMAQHGEVFALVKRLGRSSAGTPGSDPNDVELRRRYPNVRLELLSLLRSEIVAVQEVLGKIAQAQELTRPADTSTSELAEAISTLEALNLDSPEWAPAFMQVSELVEAQVVEDQREGR